MKLTFLRALYLKYISSDISDSSPPPSPFPIWQIAALVSVMSASFVSRLFLLFSSPFPPGSDGYVYLVQVRSLIEGHGLHYPDPSPLYLLLFPIALAAGPSAALKIAIALICALFPLPLHLLARRISHDNFRPLLVCVWGAFSPASFFIAAQFPKQFLGIVLFLFITHAVAARKIYSLPFLIAATVLAHRITAMITVIWFALLVIASLRRRYVLITLGAVSLLFLMLSFIPGAIGVADITRLGGINYDTIQVPILSFITMGLHLHPVIVIEAVISFFLIISAIVYLTIRRLKKHRSMSWYIASVILCAALSIPLFSFGPDGAGYRIYLCTIPLSIVLAAVFPFRARISMVLAALIVIAGIAYTATERASKYDPPYRLYESVARRAGTLCAGRDVKLYIAHKGLAETIDYTLRADALAWRPEKRFDRTRTWRVAKWIEPWEIARATGVREDDSRITRISAVYCLVREDLWDILIEKISSDQNDTHDLHDRVFSRDNPHEYRPAYLTRGRKYIRLIPEYWEKLISPPPKKPKGA
jgi:hypothetical protein